MLISTEFREHQPATVHLCLWTFPPYFLKSMYDLKKGTLLGMDSGGGTMRTVESSECTKGSQSLHLVFTHTMLTVECKRRVGAR